MYIDHSTTIKFVFDKKKNKQPSLANIFEINKHDKRKKKEKKEAIWQKKKKKKKTRQAQQINIEGHMAKTTERNKIRRNPAGTQRYFNVVLMLILGRDVEQPIFNVVTLLISTLGKQPIFNDVSTSDFNIETKLDFNVETIWFQCWNNVGFQRWNSVRFQPWNNFRFQRWNNVIFQRVQRVSEEKLSTFIKTVHDRFKGQRISDSVWCGHFQRYDRI